MDPKDFHAKMALVEGQFEQGTAYFSDAQEDEDDNGEFSLSQKLPELNLDLEEKKKLYKELIRRNKGVRVQFERNASDRFKELFLYRAHLRCNIEGPNQIFEIYEEYSNIEELELPPLRRLVDYSLVGAMDSDDHSVQGILSFLLPVPDSKKESYPRLTNWLAALGAIYFDSEAVKTFEKYSIDCVKNHWDLETLEKINTKLSFDGFHPVKCDLAVSIFHSQPNEENLSKYLYFAGSLSVEQSRHQAMFSRCSLVLANVLLRFCLSYTPDHKQTWNQVYINTSFAKLAQFGGEFFIQKNLNQAARYYFRARECCERMNNYDRGLKMFSKGIRSLERSYKNDNYQARKGIHRIAIKHTKELIDSDCSNSVVQDTLRVHKCLLKGVNAEEAYQKGDVKRFKEKVDEAFELSEGLSFYINLSQLKELQDSLDEIRE